MKKSINKTQFLALVACLMLFAVGINQFNANPIGSLVFADADSHPLAANQGTSLQYLPIIIKPAAPPHILSLTANVDIADPGDTIELAWKTENATDVAIYHHAPTLQIDEIWQVAASGTMTYTISPGRRNSDLFSIWASNDAFPAESLSLTIPLTCPHDWFFAPPPDVCAQDAAVFSTGAVQYFEHGLMIWVEAEAHIYVLYDEDQTTDRWDIFSDDWKEGDLIDDPALMPPPGLYQPQRGFGLVWREGHLVRDRLGWAIAPETGYETATQRTSYPRYNDIYIQADDGNVWRLLPEGSDWEKVILTD